MKYDLFDLPMIISKEIIFVGGLQVEQFQEITLKKSGFDRIPTCASQILTGHCYQLRYHKLGARHIWRIHLPMAQMVLKLKNFTDMNLTFRFNFFFTDSNHS